MSEKRFELRLCPNGTYYVWENGELVIDHISFDKWHKEDANDLIDLLNELSEENEQLRQIIKDIVCATDETYTKNTSMFKVTVVFDGKMYNQIRSCLYE